MAISKPRQVGEKDKIIGERIRTQRMVQKMSQYNLASELGVSFQQVQKYEKGANRISAVRLAEIATVIGTNVMTLLNGVDGDGDALSTPVSKFMATKVGIELIEGMLEIKEPEVRQAIVSLVEALRSR